MGAPPAECEPSADGGPPCDGGDDCPRDTACNRVPTGGEGEPCGTNLECDPGLFCVSGLGDLGSVCEPAGAENQLCRPQFECDAGLFCIIEDPTGPRCRSPGAVGDRCTNESCSDGLVCSYADICPDQQDYACCLAAGGEGEACEVGGICDAGLLCGNCVGFMEGCCATTGGEGELCGPDNACDPGLICVFGPGSPLRLCQPAGGEDQDCLPDFECNAGLFCIADDSGRHCHAPGEVGDRCTNESCSDGLICTYADICPEQQDYACCLAAGGEGEACEVGGVCDAGLACADCDGFMEGCCVATGGEGEQCGVDNACDPGLICVFGPGSPTRLCQPAGGENEPCLPDFECDAGLFCITDDPSGPHCYPPGEVGERCTGESCSEGLVCTFADTCPDQQDYACCLASGGEGEACDAGGICDAGLECGSCEGFMEGCCVAAG